MMISIVQKRIFVFVSLAVLISSPLLLVRIIQSRYGKEHPLIGTRVPSIIVSTRSGTTFSLTYRGNKYILIFFSVECPHCMNELSNFDLIYNQFKQKINVFAVSLSKPNKTKALLTSRTYPFPVFQAEESTYKDSIKIFDLPTILYIDEQQILRHYYIGDRNIAEERMLLTEFSNESFKGNE
jgi:peroxiredoxin